MQASTDATLNAGYMQPMPPRRIDTNHPESESKRMQPLTNPYAKRIAERSPRRGGTKRGAAADVGPLLGRTILHLDVDCFYCQCEILADPTGRLASSPVAIQQKHIIVTCNYLARGLGVRKLMGKEDAVRACPSLVIVNGSDLTPYRRQSRRIYGAFREAIRTLLPGGSRENAASKGGMDEMYADISFAVMEGVEYDGTLHGLGERSGVEDSSGKGLFTDGKNAGAPREPNANDVFVYGDENCTVSICEDQSGAEARIISAPQTGRAHASCLASSRSVGSTARHQQHMCSTPSAPDAMSASMCDSIDMNSHVDQWGTGAECEAYAIRLRHAATLAAKIKAHVRKATGFSTCVGISANPMLAKIASELKKPDSLNVLYPWRSGEIVVAMPLRRVPELGSRTLKALESCLQEHVGHREGEFWTCSDLLNVPQNTITSCLTGPSRYTNASAFLDRCRGVDDRLIDDDEGGLAKTVSVEDSYRRGTLGNTIAAKDALKVLCVRLPKLLLERQSDSDSPELAHPSTVRVTVRNIAGGQHIVRSKQASLNGKALLLVTDETQRSTALHRATSALLEDLLLGLSKKDEFDVTRMNIAATNFVDVKQRARNEGCSGRLGQSSVAQYFTPHAPTSEVAVGSSPPGGKKSDSPRPVEETERQRSPSTNNSFRAPATSNPNSVASARLPARYGLPDPPSSEYHGVHGDNDRGDIVSSQRKVLPSALPGASKERRRSAAVIGDTGNDIDPAVFAVLPLEIQEEILLSWRQSPFRGKGRLPRQKKRKGIDQYFGRK